ncbi:MAG: bifunctional UDP-N-acetylglucosamine diphosphorylase/glucosamine-1-phosphate N-acetyltransferase GlmU, partial [Burkholderiaceae bacterium]
MNIVILAAGMGKRMRSDQPKVLHRIAGRPMLGWVLDLSASLVPSRTVVVHGHGAETVRAAFPDPALGWALQSPQLGTGHAVMQALPLLDDSVPTLVLYGDVPLTRSSTLERLKQACAGGALGLLTVDLPDPSGYGRIVRNPAGQVQAIVEHKDASPDQRLIRECNTGILLTPTPALRRWLAALSNNNAQGEYYLTDIVAMAVAEGLPVATAQPDAAWETLGVNSKSQLAELERIHQRTLAESLMDAGVGLADPARI